MSSLDLARALEIASEKQRAGEGTVIVAVVSATPDSQITPGIRMVVDELGCTFGDIHSVLRPLIVEDALASLAEKRSRMRSYAMGDSRAERARVGKGDVSLFFDVQTLPPKLIVVGAGHIAVPLVRIAKEMDFEVIVVDDRPDYGNAERFPGADAILVGPYAETLAKLPITRDTYIVLVTRGHVHDQACLERVAGSGAAYIGMIGSRRRVQTVIRHIAEKHHDPSLLERVFAPIGLDIGSHSPAEIAVAIAAEMVSVRRGGKGASISLRNTRHA